MLSLSIGIIPYGDANIGTKLVNLSAQNSKVVGLSPTKATKILYLKVAR